MTLDALAKKTLEISVWDYDLGMSNDFIGRLDQCECSCTYCTNMETRPGVGGSRKE